MSVKKYIKSHSDDPFEKVTGVKLYEVDGQLNCRITPNSRMLFAGKQYMARYIAASIYLNKPVADLTNIEVTCGVKNCVHPSHILYNTKNLNVDNDGKLLSADINLDAPASTGLIHGYHPDTWNELSETNKQRVREGTYDPAVHNWG